MGLAVTTVNVETMDGDPITEFWIKIIVHVLEKPLPEVEIELKAYRSEALLDAYKSELRLRDSGNGLATDIPSYLGRFSVAITPTQYANLNMSTTIHNKIKAILEQGDSWSGWDTIFTGLEWAGLGAGKVTVEMPS